MFAEREGEDGNVRLRRIHQESEARKEVIRQRDAEDQPSPVERVALNQMSNKSKGLPLDYQAILDGRAECAGLFAHLPSDAECRKALGIEEPPAIPVPPVGEIRDTSRPDEVLQEPEAPAEEPQPKTAKQRRNN